MKSNKQSKNSHSNMVVYSSLGGVSCKWICGFGSSEKTLVVFPLEFVDPQVCWNFKGRLYLYLFLFT